ncbi:phosphodiesterase [Miniphocaeibacter massiliensis]|uniref:phosphodiesterase n=1 Tax=Miniphocaeibacter massiliensis TaxID=2041841 RepID=UPI000C06E2F6|nr:phosphodiesterase [Miniphocaeibacter massiliensis]
MKIGIISDTHGDIVQTKKALSILKDCEYIIHCGDVLYHGPRNDLPKNYNPKDLALYLSELDNIIYIRGNCDSDVDEMVMKKDLSHKSRLLELDGHTIFAIHGYEEIEQERIKKAEGLKANIIVSGHTHIKILKKVNNLIIINPGSTTIPKDGSSSVAKIDGNVVELIDLEKNTTIKKLDI